MRKFSIVFISCVLILIGSNLNAAVVETFDTDLGGWSGNPVEEVKWAETGGNTGGYASFMDGSGVSTYLHAPNQHLGDWSGADKGGSITFDHKIFETGVEVLGYADYTVIITGSAGSAVWTGDSPSGVTDWTTISAVIGTSSWDLNVSQDSEESLVLTDEQKWDKLLADVTGLKIGIEMVGNNTLPGDQCGIDNIEVNSVPLPGALWLLGSGLLGALGLRRATKS